MFVVLHLGRSAVFFFLDEAGSPTFRLPCCDGFLTAGIPLKSAHR